MFSFNCFIVEVEKVINVVIFLWIFFHFTSIHVNGRMQQKNAEWCSASLGTINVVCNWIKNQAFCFRFFVYIISFILTAWCQNHVDKNYLNRRFSTRLSTINLSVSAKHLQRQQLNDCKHVCNLFIDILWLRTSHTIH